jgi:hypothetical protein
MARKPVKKSASGTPPGNGFVDVVLNKFEDLFGRMRTAESSVGDVTKRVTAHDGSIGDLDRRLTNVEGNPHFDPAHLKAATQRLEKLK